jgi:hypothetical protein
MIDESWAGSRYVIVDYAITTIGEFGGRFSAVAVSSGSSPVKFYDVYYQSQQQGSKLVLTPGILYYPEYYRSLAIRLYNFDGKVAAESPTVISYQDKVSPDGIHYKQIVSSKSFSSYKEAEAYISSQKSGNYRIVSDNPFVSPVPLEALKHYKLAYSSASTITQAGATPIPEVKIFEYVK